MILTQRDINDFVNAYSDYQINYGKLTDEDVWMREQGLWHKSWNYWSNYRFCRWLDRNPQVVMASGLQEYVSSISRSDYRLLVDSGSLNKERVPAFRVLRGTWIIPSIIPRDDRSEWECFELSPNLDADGLPPTLNLPSAREIITNAERFLHSPHNDPTLFFSPKIWTPGVQKKQTSVLIKATTGLIHEIRLGRMRLQDVSWQTLEDLVAETLRNSGLEIWKAQSRPQGGRDIIARGCLIPGEPPSLIAVEVKHRKLVDRPELQASLYQNRMFPTLMFVTSGTFTAGLLQEASLPEVQHRIILKDGVAFRDMLHRFPLVR